MINVLRHISGIANGASIRLERLCYGRQGEKEFMKAYPADYGLLAQNKELENLHKGKRCFIVGNGPSLNKQNLSLLADEYVFTVNYIYKNKQFSSMKTNYHFFTDPGCFNAEKHQPEEFSAVCTENNNPICFLPVNGGEQYARETGLDKMMPLRYIFDFVPYDEPIEIRSDLTKGITGFYTVIQTAVIAAIYMGFTEIYLLGCDCTGIVTNIDTLTHEANVRGYSYEFSNTDKQKLLDEYKNRIKLSDTFSGWVKVFTGYERLFKYCNMKNISLMNATDGGVLDSIPRVDYKSLFEG